MDTCKRSSYPDSPHPGDEHPSDWIAKPYSIAFTSVVLFILIFGTAIFQGCRQFETTRHNVLTTDKITLNLLAALIQEHNKATIGILQSYAYRPLFIDAVKNKDLAGAYRHLFDSNRDWYKGVSSHWKPYISTVFELIVGDKPLAVPIFVPIFDEKERVIGILASSQRLGFLVDTVARVPFSPYTTVNVIDRMGHILCSNKFPYQESITNYRFFPILEPSLKEIKHPIEMNDPQKDHEKKYLTFIPVGDIGWTVIIERSLRDIYRSALSRFIEIGAISFLLFFLIIFVLFYLQKATVFRKTEELLHAEIKLRQSEKELQWLFKSMINAFVIFESVLDDDGNFVSCRFVYINDAYECITGVKNKEVKGKTIHEVWPETEPEWIKRYSDVAVTGASHAFELYHDSTKKLYNCNVYRSGDTKDRFCVIFEDITERKRTEETLRRSEENFRHSFDDSPMGMRIVTLEGETVYANRAILDIYGYDSIEDLKTTPVEMRYTPESYAEFKIRSEKRRQGVDVPSEYKISIVRKDEKIRHLQVFRKEILWNAEEQFQVIYRDITEHDQVQEALRESEEKWRSLVLYSPDFIALHDREGRYLFLNRYADGFTEKDVLGKKADEFVSQGYREIYRDAFEGCIRTMTKQLIEYSAMGDSAKERMYESAFVPIIGHGNEINVLVVAKDITKRKQAEDKLRISRLQLRALAMRLQRIREEERLMIAQEIHDEMGGVLTGLKMDFSWLLGKMGDTSPGEERAALMDRIHTSNALIDQMIHVVRRISTDLRPSVLDDLGLIAALEWQLSEFTSRTEIQHEFSTTSEYVSMEKETAVAVFRIFQETLTNVVRHSLATKVSVILREGKGSLFRDESLVLEIRDNGRGITEEEILNPESLGLLGMKERALAFGGELSFSGEPDEGTSVILKIPQIGGKPL